MELQKSNILTHFYLRLLHESCSLFCCLMWEPDMPKSAFPLVRLDAGVQLGGRPELGRHTKDCLLCQVSWKSGWLFIAPGQKGSLRNICVCVCVCVCVCACAHIYGYTHICTHTHMHMVSMHTCICTYTLAGIQYTGT